MDAGGDEDMNKIIGAVTTATQALNRAVRRALQRFEHEREESTSEVTARWHFAVTVESDPLDGGFIAFIADLPGVMSQGETEREAVHNLSEAFADVLFARLEQAGPTVDEPDQPQLFTVPPVLDTTPHRRPQVAIAR